jgi:C-terminal processing protease CtpA/Prc
MQAFLKQTWQRRLAALSLGGLFVASPLLAQTVPAPVTPQPVVPAPAKDTPRPALRDAIEKNRETREENRENREVTREQNRDNRELNRDTRANSVSPADRAERRERVLTRLGVALNAATNGLRLSNVQPNSAFGTAGLRNDDVILRVGDRRFADNAAFHDWLLTVQPGQQFGIVVQRNGREETINWTPTEQWSRDFNADDQVAAPRGQLGITLDAQQTQAAIVAEVAPGSLADRAGIRPRDQIVSLNGEKVGNAADFQNLSGRIDASGPIDLGFSRVVSLHSAAKPVTSITIPLPERRDAPNTLPMPVTPRVPQPNPSVTPPLPAPR